MRAAWRIAALLQGVMLKPLSAIVELLIPPGCNTNICRGKKFSRYMPLICLADRGPGRGVAPRRTRPPSCRSPWPRPLIVAYAINLEDGVMLTNITAANAPTKLVKARNGVRYAHRRFG